jgi:hypothetical protein
MAKKKLVLLHPGASLQFLPNSAKLNDRMKCQKYMMNVYDGLIDTYEFERDVVQLEG